MEPREERRLTAILSADIVGRTCEQWIKESKGAIRWTRLSCRSFAANAVRLQLHALAYNLANVMRRLALPEAVAHWSLASLRGEARQDRRQDRHACPVRHLPDGRGRGAEGIGPGYPAADRRTTTKTGPSVGTGTVGCTITTGGVYLNDENKPQIGLSKMEHRAQHAGCVPEAVFRLPGTPAKW